MNRHESYFEESEVKESLCLNVFKQFLMGQPLQQYGHKVQNSRAEGMKNVSYELTDGREQSIRKRQAHGDKLNGRLLSLKSWDEKQA